MTYQNAWHDSGGLADEYCWPKEIENDNHNTVLLCERDHSPVGCPGFVQYEIGGTLVTFAFSNPSIGHNKLNVGTGVGREVWDTMSWHQYEPFVIKISIGNTHLTFNCECSGGTTNVANISICNPAWRPPAQLSPSPLPRSGECADTPSLPLIAKLTPSLFMRDIICHSYTVINVYYTIPQGVLHSSYHIIPLHYHGNMPIYSHATPLHTNIWACCSGNGGVLYDNYTVILHGVLL
jgi:hypothetical protein